MPRAGSFPSNVNGSGWEASSGLVRGYYQQRPAEQEVGWYGVTTSNDLYKWAGTGLLPATTCGTGDDP
jgi:hypothetical protein